LKTKDLLLRLPAGGRILLIRLRSMGDCLLLTSPARALKEEFPRLRLSVLVESRFAGCFDGNPDFDEVIAIPRKLSALRLALRRYHAVINLHGGPTSLLYSMLAWGPRFGGAGFQFKRLYQGNFPEPPPGLHSVAATLDIFRWMGLQRAEPPPLRFEPHPEEAARMRKAMQGRRYAVLHPGALLETKRWAPERFGELAKSLQESGLSIAITCGPGEEGIVAKVAQMAPDPIMLLGLTIPELAELIRGAELFAGNDSGPMHLSAAVGTPVVALWGSSNSTRWRPWGVEHRVVQNPFECNPCAGYRCHVAETPLCIESVTVEQAIEAAKDIQKRDVAHAPPG
jgi:ADP-heptose:LPS heptosyltransferase